MKSLKGISAKQYIFEECCGCGACETICPVNAIYMHMNIQGFRYPKIEEEMCIRCGECLLVCNFRKKS